MNAYDQKNECCGCTACLNACPQKAIVMQTDSEGFFYPQTDERFCINCGICKKVCPFQNSLPKKNEPIVFAAKHRDPEVLEASSSGGVFTAISDFILKSGGVVYGVAFDENFNVCHQRAQTLDQRDKFRGSKYVQSNLNETFDNIARDLENGLIVLFSGTPCQCAGLRNYLAGIKYNRANLYLCDFICHGVSSPLAWRDYVKFLEHKYQQRLVYFSFRNKENGWANSQQYARFAVQNSDESYNTKYSFLNLYRSLYITRPSCFNCLFASYNRIADITLGDFWNIGNSKPHMDDDKGTSSVIISSQKGLYLFDAIKNDLIWEQSNPADCWQPHLEYPPVEPKGRGKFWDEYCKYGFDYVMQKYGKGTASSRIIRTFTPLLKKAGLYRFAGKVYGKIFRRNAEAKG